MSSLGNGYNTYNGSTRIDNNQACLYDSCQITKRTIFHPMVAVSPVSLTAAEQAAGQSPVSTFQLGTPWKEEIVEFEFVKDRCPPVIPSPRTVGYATFTGGSLDTPAPLINADGSRRWVIRGQYRYAITAPSAGVEYTGIIVPGLAAVEQSQVDFATAFGGGLPAAAPPEVQAAGVGPQAGYTWSTQVADPTVPGLLYNEPTYLPGLFFATTFYTGPTVYPAAGSGPTFGPPCVQAPTSFPPPCPSDGLPDPGGPDYVT